jgi:hypothetical protein
MLRCMTVGLLGQAPTTVEPIKVEVVAAQVHTLVREFDLAGPLLLSEMCLARALINRMRPGECTVFRSRWQETHHDLIHLCNVLGHEFIEAGYDGVHYLMKVRVRACYDRVPRRDPTTIDYPQPRSVVTLDVTPNSLQDPRLRALEGDGGLAARLLSWFR